jgi:hypothetical protein
MARMARIRTAYNFVWKISNEEITRNADAQMEDNIKRYLEKQALRCTPVY